MKHQVILVGHQLRALIGIFIFPLLRERLLAKFGLVCFVLFSSYHFHVIVDDGITYLCMADEEFGKRQPYAFLEEVCQILDLQKVDLPSS